MFWSVREVIPVGAAVNEKKTRTQELEALMRPFKNKLAKCFTAAALGGIGY